MSFPKGHKYNVGRECSWETRAKLSASNSKERVIVNCGSCGKIMFLWPSVAKSGKGKFCSKACMAADYRSRPAWNKGLKGFREGEKRYCMPSGKNHWSWKGESISYSGIHQWVRKELGTASHCEGCGLDKVPDGKKRYFDWANISQEYKRELGDWKQLCKKCHGQFDSLARRKAKEN